MAIYARIPLNARRTLIPVLVAGLAMPLLPSSTARLMQFGLLWQSERNLPVATQLQKRPYDCASDFILRM